jgi:hypothetical protein
MAQKNESVPKTPVPITPAQQRLLDMYGHHDAMGAAKNYLTLLYLNISAFQNSGSYPSDDTFYAWMQCVGHIETLLDIHAEKV